MKPTTRFTSSAAFICGLALFFAPLISAQSSTVRSLITQSIDENKLVVLRGNTHPLARPEFDRGPVAPDFAMDRMLLVLKRSPQQEAALEKLMAEQQNQGSPNYHKWLTPDEFGKQFGPSDQDVQRVEQWLQSHGFAKVSVSVGRTNIEFSGTAAQVQEAFHTQMHSYVVRGERHWANASDPSIPAALTPAVAGVASLHNFYPKPQSHATPAISKISAARSSASRRPMFTFTDNLGNQWFALGPTDFATIYDVTPLWNQGFDGSGETIAVLTDSNINIQDDRDFRTIFALPPNDPVVTVNGTDPGLLANGDEVEAILDVEWSGAVAKGATINLVVSKSTPSTFGGDLSATFVVNENTPPAVMSESFGQCELALGTSENSFLNSTWQQAASEGITVVVSTGDDGSAGCDFENQNGPLVQPATGGLAVNGLASTPFNVAVGGTEFNDPNPLLYFSSGNLPGSQASALSYIPEMTYNDTCTDAVIYTFFGFSGTNAAQDACNSAAVQDANSPNPGFVVTVGGSGGVSSCTTSTGTQSSCSGGYAKPSWQTALTPSDGKRDLPDVSMFAGDGTISGSFYVLCNRDFSGINGAACNLNNETFLFAGGTSVSAQVFAGIMALVDQRAGSTQGNPNPTLYTLAGQQSSTSCNSNGPPISTCVFNDVTVGTIAMPCEVNTSDCVVSNATLTPWLRPTWPATWASKAVAILACLLLPSLSLLGFPGKPRRLGAAFCLLTMATLLGMAGCGGSNGGNNGGGGGGGGGNATIGVLSGYNAGTGYDLATGLGSVDVNNLANANGWK